jgi:tRNA(adenine34) deaminase
MSTNSHYHPNFSFKNHDVLPLAQLDEALYEVQLDAYKRGLIPISGIISREVSGGRHEILGFGSNRLRDGVPGIHGETGAIMNMGRIPGGYRDLIATSTLSPCLFCQCCLARQMGIRKVRILNGTDDYCPDEAGYKAAGIEPIVVRHALIEKLFAEWVRDPQHQILWKRDIGIATGLRLAPFKPKSPEGWQKYVDRAKRLAGEALESGEAPIGAVIVDELGEVAGSGFPGIVTQNDPSLTAAVAAWRSCGSRDDWGRHTLVLSCGPDHIAYSMFKIFRFGQLVVGSDRVYAGQIDGVRELTQALDETTKVPVHVLHDQNCDAPLREWLERKATSPELTQEYFGADYRQGSTEGGGVN